MANRASLLLLIGLAGALVWGTYEWLRPLPSPPEAEPANATPPQTLEIATNYVPDVTAFDAIVERPLFVPGRQPVAEATSAAGTVRQPTEIGNLRLTAVVIDGERLTALVETAAGKTEQLTVGSQLDIWQVDEIQDDQIVITADGRRQTLEVYRFDSPTVVKPRKPRRKPRARRPRLIPNPEPEDAAPDPPSATSVDPQSPSEEPTE